MHVYRTMPFPLSLLRLLLLSAATCCQDRNLTAATCCQDLNLTPRVLHSSCTVTGDCSRRLQALLAGCTGASSELECALEFLPAAATFKLEQPGAVAVADVSGGLVLRGNGARLVFEHGDAQFVNIRNCSGVVLSNLTLVALRPPHTLGVVVAPSLGAPGGGSTGTVALRVDTARYPFAEPYGYLAKVDAMYEVDADFRPTMHGLDWIYGQEAGPPGRAVQLSIGPSQNGTAIVTFRDRAFGLVPGSRLVLRHVLEFSRPALDSVVIRGCDGVTITDVTINTAPGMAVLTHDCTDVTLTRVRIVPADGMPIAANADAIHLASGRGQVTIVDCACDRQGDDGVNVHSQYAVVVSAGRDGGVGGSGGGGDSGGRPAGTTRLALGPHANADKSSWGCLFSRPVFRPDDTVAVRRRAGLNVVLQAKVHAVEGDPSNPPLIITIANAAGVEVSQGDIVEPLSAVPDSVVIINSTFSNSRASGIILQTDNVLVDGNTIANVSSGAVAIGGYWSAFGESSFGSNISVTRNTIAGCGRGHRTNTGGGWGMGAAVRTAGSSAAPNTTTLHRNITIAQNTISTVGSPWLSPASGAMAVSAQAVTGLSIVGNTVCVPGDKPVVATALHCASVEQQNNRCCVGGDPSKQGPCAI